MLLNVNGTWDSQWLRKRVSKFQLVWDKQASDSMCRDIRDPRVPYVEEPLMWTFKKKLFVQTSVTCQNVLSFPYEALLHSDSVIDSPDMSHTSITARIEKTNKQSNFNSE